MRLFSRIRLGVAGVAVAGTWLLFAAKESLAGSAEPSGGWEFRAVGEQHWAAQPPEVKGGVLLQIEARVPFQVSQPASASFWEFTPGFTPGQIESWSVDGRAIPLPLSQMRYITLPGIPAPVLREGSNALSVILRIDNRLPEDDLAEKREPINIPVPGDKPVLTPQKLAFRTGPFLGAFDREFSSIACMTTVPIAATLKVFFPGAQPGIDVSPVTMLSKTGYVHRFHFNE